MKILLLSSNTIWDLTTWIYALTVAWAETHSPVDVLLSLPGIFTVIRYWQWWNDHCIVQTGSHPKCSGFHTLPGLAQYHSMNYLMYTRNVICIFKAGRFLSKSLKFLILVHQLLEPHSFPIPIIVIFSLMLFKLLTYDLYYIRGVRCMNSVSGWIKSCLNMTPVLKQE